MKHHAKDFKIAEMATVLGVSTSGYYHYCQRPKSQREEVDQQLLRMTEEIFLKSRQTYGRIRRALLEKGVHCSERRISRLMKENGWVPRAAKRFKVTTQARSDAKAAPNELAQLFEWAADLTYIWTTVGWLYVAVVMDLYSRKIIGLSMGKRITTELVIKAFLQAMSARGYPEQVLYHSDRGSQYTSRQFQKLMKLYKIKVSMSGKGNCYDNAVIESFFHTLKVECTDDLKFHHREEAIAAIFDYIPIFYNNYRMHSYLGYLSPHAFENTTGARKIMSS